jgi:hypothetical protein
MLTPSLQHIYFFHFSNTWNLGSNGSTRFWEPLLWRAALTLILECYAQSCAHNELTLELVLIVVAW